MSKACVTAVDPIGRRCAFAILFALIGAVGEPVSAQVPANATTDELKKLKEDATLRKEINEAQLAADKAQREREALQATGSQAAAAKSAKDLADARKAQADAEKAEADAALAATKAKFGEIPASGYSGTAEMGAGAGNAEAMLLGSMAVNKLADRLAESLKTDKPADVNKLLLYTAQTVPDFQAMLAFNAQVDALEVAMRQAREATKDAEAGAEQGLGMSVATVGLGLEAVNKVLAFFKSDYKFQGVEVASSDSMLLAALARGLRARGLTVEVPATYQPAASSGAGMVLDRATSLYGWALHARNRIRLHNLVLPKLEADLAQKQKDKAEEEARKLAERVQKVKDAVATWTAIGDRIDAWAKQAAGADDKGNVPLATIIRQAAVHSALDQGGALVVLQLHKVAGTGYTKKNMWSSLGANPFYVMGGAVASVMAFHGKTGQVFSAALLPWHGGYHSVSDIQSVVNK